MISVAVLSGCLYLSYLLTYSVPVKYVTVVADGDSKLMANKHISLPSAFAAGDPTEICCRANEWSDAVKALKLSTLLESEPLQAGWNCLKQRRRTKA